MAVRVGGSMGDEHLPPPAERRLIAIAVVTATFLVGMDTVIISTAMPTVVGQLGGLDLYAWVFSAYLLATTVTVPIYGKLADLYGRKPIFLAAAGLFLIGSALCGQAQTMEQLILFRVIQGIGGGGVQPVTMLILADSFSLSMRARMTGLFSVVWGTSSLIGPAIGGFLTEQVSWRWVFYVNIPLCVLSMALLWRLLRENRRFVGGRRRLADLDFAGAGLLAASVVALLFGLRGSSIEGGGTSTTNVPLLGLSAVLAVAFVWQERRVPEPIVPLSIFRRRLIAVGTVSGMIIGIVSAAQGTFVPPYVQGVMGASPTVTGFVTSSATIGWPVSAALSAVLMMRFGYRVVGLTGGIFLLVGCVLLAMIQPDDSIAKMVIVNVLVGAGLGFMSPMSVLYMQNAVPLGQRGVAASANQFARSLGGTLGVSLAGALFAASVAGALVAVGGSDPNQLLSVEGRALIAPDKLQSMLGALDSSLHLVYWMLAGLAVIALVMGALLPSGDPNRHVFRETSPPEEPEPEPAARDTTQTMLVAAASSPRRLPKN